MSLTLWGVRYITIIISSTLVALIRTQLKGDCALMVFNGGSAHIVLQNVNILERISMPYVNMTTVVSSGNTGSINNLVGRNLKRSVWLEMWENLKCNCGEQMNISQYLRR